jgi:hypothetical protein
MGGDFQKHMGGLSLLLKKSAQDRLSRAEVAMVASMETVQMDIDKIRTLKGRMEYFSKYNKELVEKRNILLDDLKVLQEDLKVLEERIDAKRAVLREDEQNSASYSSSATGSSVLLSSSHTVNPSHSRSTPWRSSNANIPSVAPSILPSQPTVPTPHIHHGISAPKPQPAILVQNTMINGDQHPPPLLNLRIPIKPLFSHVYKISIHTHLQYTALR